MFDLLEAAQVRNNDAPTRDHSYLTIRSLGALKYGLAIYPDRDLNKWTGLQSCLSWSTQASCFWTTLSIRRALRPIQLQPFPAISWAD